MRFYSCPAIALSVFALVGLGLDHARAATPIVSDPAITSLGIVTGGDAGEGLDLDGTFVYALSIGADVAQFSQVRDATFLGIVDAEVPGATVTAGNTILNWYTIDYGDTANDDALEIATSSIRWSDANNAENPQVLVTLENLEAGGTYKVQLMFGEQCCNRGFDVYFDDRLAVKDFNPGVLHGGIAQGKQEAVITQTYFAKGTTLVVRLDGRKASPDYADHNAILNGLTVEKIAGRVDSDNDNLPDEWEKLYFPNLDQTGAGDADQDTISNADEFAAGTNPNNADTDGDGLSEAEEKTAGTSPLSPDTDGDGLQDGNELKTTKTDPLKADTDGDNLADGLETRQYNTDPLKADTDGDGFSDSAEVFAESDPTKSDSVPSLVTKVGVFTGGDTGEGLDLDGNFLYALSFGADVGQAVTVRDATFLGVFETEVPGATVQAGNTILNWYTINYGDTQNDQNLALATTSIRWSDAGNADNPQVVVTLDNLEAGGTYKVQLMFGEQCCSRGFDVYFDDVRVLHNFAPFRVQGGIAQGRQEALITHTHFAKGTTLVIRLDGRGVTDPAITDHNAIFNALTLEKIAGKVDSDNDGLLDEFEKLYYGNLSETGSGDFDKDGLSNSVEFDRGTDSANADTDGDGLKDGAETSTDPLNRDSDGDRLLDGAEVTSGTDPGKKDTDGDGVEDGAEVLDLGTDPKKADPLKLSNIVVQSFTGGDPGEGLDLQGNFLYAFNVSSVGAAGKAGDADFTADDASGITVVAPNNIPSWDMPEFGDSPNDTVIEKVMQSIRFGPTVRVELSGLVPGSTYKLQMLFYEQCCAARGFNIYAEGALVAESFVPNETQGGVDNTSAGAVVSAEFDARRDKLLVVLDAAAASREDLTDPNAILDGLTLEILKLSDVAPAPKITSIARTANGFSITCDSVAGKTYSLEYKENLTDASWQAGEQKAATGTSTTLTDNTPAHLARQGFWRVRVQ